MASHIRGVGDNPSALAEMAQRARRDRTGEAESGARGPGGLPNRGDAVNITDAAAKVRAAEASLASVPVVDERRVEQIRESIADGTYRVNPDRVAAKLVSLEQSLAGASGGDDGSER